MGRKKHSKQKTNKTTLYWITFTLLALLLFYPPYFRGLFFDKELLPTHIFTGIIFALWCIYKLSIKKDYTFFKTPLDYAAFALVAAYFISMFAAVNIRLAVGELLKYINYFMVYLIVSEIAESKNDIKIILNIMLASALGVAILGIGAAAGTFTYNGAFVNNRINSSIQYPNSLAIYLTAALIISFTLQALSKKQWYKYIYSASNFILFFTIIFTYSRGTWLTLPVILILFFLGLPKGKKLTSILYFMVVLISSAICIPGFWKGVTAQNSTAVWMWFFIGIILSTAGIYPVNYIVNLNRKIKIIAAAAILLLLITGVIAVINIEEPLTLQHTADEPDSWKTLVREVEVKPDTEYILDVDIKSSNPEDKPWAWRILVRSVDEKGNRQNLLVKHEKNLKEGEKLSFKTPEKVKKVEILFFNYYQNTKATFENVNLIQKDSPHNIKHITLKYKFIPENLVQRIKRINLEGKSQLERFVFYKDALKIVRDYPIIGTGGGGWEVLFTKYQSAPYWSTEVHSQFFQTWVETGTVGFIALIAIWIVLLFIAYKNFKQGDIHSRTLSLGIFLSAFALGAHSWIDFNLSLGAISLYLWQLFALNKSIYILNMTNTAERVSEKSRKYYNQRPIITKYFACIGLSLLFILISTSLLIGYNYGQKAVAYIKQKDIIKAKEAFEKATKFDPLTSSYHVDLSQIYKVIGQKTKSEEMLKKSEEELKTALKLDPYNDKINLRYADYLLSRGKIDEGLKYLEKAGKLYPFKTDYYEYLTRAYRDIAKHYILKGKKQKAAPLLEKGLKLEKAITKLNMNIPKYEREKLNLTSEILTSIQQMRYLYDNIDDKKAAKEVDNIVLYNGLTFDTDGDDIPDLCRIANNLKVQIKAQDREKIIRITNSGKKEAYIMRQNLNLQPRHLYSLSFEARGTVSDETFDVYVISQNGTREQLEKTGIKLSKEFERYEFMFLTTKDIEPGKQILRFDHNGNDEGYIEIKGITLHKN